MINTFAIPPPSGCSNSLGSNLCHSRWTSKVARTVTPLPVFDNGGRPTVALLQYQINK